MRNAARAHENIMAACVNDSGVLRAPNVNQIMLSKYIDVVISINSIARRSAVA